VELVESPKLSREMKKYRDLGFEFTVRDITFFDKSNEKWTESQQGVLVDEVVPGGWAALGLLDVGDLIVDVAGHPVTDVESFTASMKSIEAAKPDVVVFRVMRGIHSMYLEMRPEWES